MLSLVMPKRFMAALCMLLMAWAGQANAQVLSFKTAINQAIDDGSSSLWLAPDLAKQVNEGFGRNPDERIRVSMQRQQVFNPQCARVLFVFNDTSNKGLFEMAMNLCKDGSPPLEGVDWGTPITDGEATTVPRFVPSR